jgi:hypothetical protein
MLRSLLSHYKKAEWEQSGVAHSGAPNQGISPQTSLCAVRLASKKSESPRSHFFVWFLFLSTHCVKIKVVRQDGTKIDYTDAVVRTVLRIIDAIPFVVPYLLGAILYGRQIRSNGLEIAQRIQSS